MELATGSPVLAVLGTRHDHPASWLGAGQALASVLLSATAAGVSASFLNQPLELSNLRHQVGDIVGAAGNPQIILRMGYGPEVPPTPRRSIEDMTV